MTVEERLKAVLEYEAQINRRDLAGLPGRPGVPDPVSAAERLIEGVRIELRNRRKLAAIVPELLTEALEAEFLAGVEVRIAGEAEVVRKHIEHRHYSACAGHTAPDLVAAHLAAVEAQRRGSAVDYNRVFPEREAPDYSELDSFRVCAASAVAIARIEFGLMRLRATMGATNPGQAAAFDHIAVHLVAVVRDIGAAADGLRLRGVRHATLALAMQWFTAALLTCGGISPQDRLELARCVQRLIRAALLPRPARDPARALLGEIGARAAGSRHLGEAWQRCGGEAARFFAG